MKFTDEIKKEIREAKRSIVDGATLGGVLGMVYLGATLAVNTIAMPIILGVNGLERLVGGEEQHRTATLVQKGVYPLLNGGEIAYGKFRADDGQEVILTDVCDFPSYKFLPNGKIPRADIGNRYDVTSLEGPISNKVIDLKEAK